MSFRGELTDLRSCESEILHHLRPRKNTITSTRKKEQLNASTASARGILEPLPDLLALYLEFCGITKVKAIEIQLHCYSYGIRK